MNTPKPGAPSGVPNPFANLELQISYVPPASLAAFGRKSRTHTNVHIGQIADSIRMAGFNVPVIVDDDNKVLAGNGRVEAAIQLGLAQVPIVRLSHLTAAQKRVFVIAENKLATLAGWDKEVLRIEFEELSALDLDFNLEVTGFLEPEIDAIMFSDDGSHGDKLPRLPATPVSRIGDLWLMGEHRLLCADSTEEASLLALLSGEKARTVFTDSPFNVKISGHVTGSGKHHEFVAGSGEMTDAEFTEFVAKSLMRISESVISGAIVHYVMDWRHAGHVLDAVKQTDLEYFNLAVWDKGVGGMGSYLRSRHELVFIFRKPGTHINRVELGKHGRNRHNVWCYPGVNGFGAEKARAREMHPTVKPMALVRDAILDCSARGDLVLDLFSGSGTTIIAADACGRRGAAIDLDPIYVDTGVIRWQDYSGKQARLASTGQTFAEVRAVRAAEALPEQASAAQTAADAGDAGDLPVNLPRARQRVRRSA